MSCGHNQPDQVISIRRLRGQVATFQYKYLGALEGSLDAVALRFQTTREAIFAATAATNPSMVKNSMNWVPQEGEILVIPIPPDRAGLPDRWEEVSAEGSTLGEMFEKILKRVKAEGADDRRALAPATTPEAMDLLYKSLMAPTFTAEEAYTHYLNRDFRERALRRLAKPGLPVFGLPNDDLRGPDAPVDPSDKIFVPISKPVRFAIPVAPNAQATVNVASTRVAEACAKLSEIKWACAGLRATRTEMQRIQARCTQEARELKSLAEFAANELKHAQAVRRSESEVEACLKVATSMDELAESAAKALLTAPYKKVPAQNNKTPAGGSLSAEFALKANYLCSLLNNKETVKLLHEVLQTAGDLPFVEGVNRAALLQAVDGAITLATRQNLVQAACEFASEAAYWVGDAAKSADAKSILKGAVDAMTAGQPPSADGSNVLAYIATLAFSPSGASAACLGPEPFGVCGAIFDIYMAMAISDGTEASDVSPLRLAKPDLEKVLGKVLGNVLPAVGVGKNISFDNYESLFKAKTAFGVMGELAETKEKMDTSKELFEAGLKKTLESATKRNNTEAIVDLNAARKKYGDKTVAEAFKKLNHFEEPASSITQDLAELKRFLAPVTKTIGLFKSVYTLLSAPVAIVQTLNVKDSSSMTFLDKAQAGAKLVDTFASGVEALKKLGQISSEAAEEVGALCGRVSFVLAIVVDVAEVVKAVENHDNMKAVGEGLQSVSMVLLLVAASTGGITLVIGGALLVAGIALSSHEEISDLLATNAKLQFKQRLDAFASDKDRVGQYFPELSPAIKEVTERLESVAWIDHALGDVDPDPFKLFSNAAPAKGE